MTKAAYIAVPVGCTRNALKAVRLINYFKSNGWKITESYRHADLLALSTCCFDDMSESISLKFLSIANKKKKNGTLLVPFGCLNHHNIAAIRDKFDAIPVNYKNLREMDKIIDAKIKMDQLEDANILHDSIDYLTKNYTLFDTYRVKIGLFRENPKRLITRLISGYGPPSLRPYFKKDFHIVVAQGCMGACTYCAIKFASGRLTSKPLDKILAEFRKGLSESYDVFRLTGEDVGAYGLDCDTSVVELLERLFNHKEHFRIILEDFNPRWLIRYSSELINLFVRNANRIHHIVLPIQSGSERIIQKMKRGYTGQRVAESLHCLQSAAPDIELSTHVIVGFPGETEDDFQDTVAFLREFSFKHIEAHKYSDRPNTPASKLSPRVPEAEKIRRLWLLRKEFPSECRIRI